VKDGKRASEVGEGRGQAARIPIEPKSYGGGAQPCKGEKANVLGSRKDPFPGGGGNTEKRLTVMKTLLP